MQPTFFALALAAALTFAPAQTADKAEQRAAGDIEAQRIAAIQQVIGSVISVCGPNRQGGGSGVIIDPSGIALTNHHVIVGAGTQGFGGLADGQLYPWKLIGTDPGGDVAVIQMSGQDSFPCSPLGDSDNVRVGDWALAMGNPFLLATDHVPTVTLGIVSGVKRYQPGAGQNQLVYGNCIQVDSSINPGNSGGPLFNLAGEVIGINGRGSFQDRGRVNVGLGYAISANQIKNFLPELLATKLVEHATLDAGFIDRGGKVICGSIEKRSPIAKLGLELGDELLEFEGVKIDSANQYTNLICTLPEDWPATLRIGKPDGQEQQLTVRAFGLPYPKAPRKKPMAPPDGRPPEDDDDEAPAPEEPPSEQQKRQQAELKQEMINLLSAPPGTIRDKTVNHQYAAALLKRWQPKLVLNSEGGSAEKHLAVATRLKRGDQEVGSQQIHLWTDGHFNVTSRIDRKKSWLDFDGSSYKQTQSDETQWRTLTLAEVLRDPDGLLTIALQSFVGTEGSSFSLRGSKSLLIDGAGKSDGQLAWRFRASHADDAEVFYWFDVQSDPDGLAGQLRKVAIDPDLAGGAIRFEQWQAHNNLSLPHRFVWVESSKETEVLRAEVQTVEWVTDAEADDNAEQAND